MHSTSTYISSHATLIVTRNYLTRISASLLISRLLFPKAKSTLNDTPYVCIIFSHVFKGGIPFNSMEFVKNASKEIGQQIADCMKNKVDNGHVLIYFMCIAMS